jgi:hypothetical protein
MTFQSLTEIAMLEALFFSSPSLFSRKPFQKTLFPLFVTQAEKSACLPFLSIFFFLLLVASQESHALCVTSLLLQNRGLLPSVFQHTLVGPLIGGTTQQFSSRKLGCLTLFLKAMYNRAIIDLSIS